MKVEPTPAGEPKRQSFWSTLPGILTAIAGVLTAVTGLTVALNQMRHPSAGDSQQVAISTPTTGSLTTPTVVRKDEAAGQGATLPAGQEARMGGGQHVFTILSARLDPFNAETRALRLKVQFLNNSKVFDRTYYSTFRLLVDNLPLAPVDAPLEQIEALSAIDVDYTFRIPASARQAVLRIGWNEEVSEIPIDLAASR